MSERIPVICVVDAIAVQNGKVVLIKRGIPPFQDKLCLPGGHVDFDDQNTAFSACRELLEETNLCLTIGNFNFLTVLDSLSRDPRIDARRISIVYFAIVPPELSLEDCRASSDAKEIVIRDIASLTKKDMGFDHWEAIRILKLKLAFTN
ncbi:MAG: NUDIX domain-containing protein [Patescibacteria group bacterium]